MWCYAHLPANIKVPMALTSLFPPTDLHKIYTPLIWAVVRLCWLSQL